MKKWIMIVYLMLSQAMALEEPHYEVLEKTDDFELREYSAFIEASTLVKGNFDDAGNKAFRILFKYISGNNRKKEKISMTAPVTQVKVKEEGEKISMTVPVIQRPENNDSGTYSFSFVMPSKYTLETLPIPEDRRIEIRQIKSRLVAARTYSGFWSEKKYRKNEAALLHSIHKAGLVQIDEPLFARYNAPFSLWFLRRNEVLVEVKRKVD